jgi:prevent-host-death family protein
MKNASIRDLHIRTSELVREAEEGAVIVIERRGEPVAELRPLTPKKRVPFPDMTEFRKRMPLIDVDSTDLISEDRDR